MALQTRSLEQSHAREKRARLRPPIFIFCQLQMSISLEMTYFYLLYFVMGVCKQQQMPSQFAKAFGDALSFSLAKNRRQECLSKVRMKY